MKFKIQVDYREKALIKKLNIFKEDYEYNDIIIEVCTLDIGDIIIYQDNKELLILERKSLNDLASSIQDGRYKEQSFRLTNTKIHNHNIMYIIEGNIQFWKNKFSKIKNETLYVSMFSLNYYKGFSTIYTNNIGETAEFILRITNKISKCKNKLGYYDYSNNNVTQQVYSDVVNRVKKKNITPENISEIILSQIPGVSKFTSKLIMSKFNSLHDLLVTLNNDKKCLDNITYKTKQGLIKRINKICIDNIKQYLLYQKSNIIEINTE